MKMIEDPIIYCQRCLKPGGVSFQGWQILSQSCINKELGWYDDRGSSVSH